MIQLSGDLVLPDRILTGRLVIEDGRIQAIDARPSTDDPNAFDFPGHFIVPGFIDVHVHGVAGHDTLGGSDSIASIARTLPRFGVAAFCPTTLACSPQALRTALDAIGQARLNPLGRSARVLPAHLESNFINPEYRGAQPLDCLRTFRPSTLLLDPQSRQVEPIFDGEDILAEIDRARPDVGIVTLAPELPGGLDLVRQLVASGHRVSLGHSGARYDEALEAIEAGARHATHLFNRMPPMHHREPGLAGAVLASEEIAAEVICDGYHVHPAMIRTAIASKHPSRVMAITDGTAGSGLAPGQRARLGDRTITVGQQGAFLDDGTLAGSSLTMDGAFRMLVGPVGLSVVEAATLCATTPARELGLQGHGVLAVGSVADVTVLNRHFEVVRTFIAGEQAYSAQ